MPGTIPPFAHQYEALEFDPTPTPPHPIPVSPMPNSSNPAREIAITEHQIALDHGFSAGPNVDSGLLYEAGTALLEIGHEVLRRAEEKYNALPTLEEASATHTEVISDEERRDAVVDLTQFRLDPRGDLRIWNQSTTSPRVSEGTWGTQFTALSDHAMSQLSVRAPGNVNRSLSGKTTQEMVRLRTRVSPPSAQVHTNTGKREAYAIVGSGRRGFQPFDTDKLLAEVSRVAPEMKAEVTYDRDSTVMRCRAVSASAPLDIPVFQGTGRVHRIGFDVWSADNGTMSMRVGGFLLRVRCLNATLVEHHHKARRRFRHVGAISQLSAGILETINAVKEATRELVDLWGRKMVEYYLDEDNETRLSPQEAIQRLVVAKLVPTAGLTQEEAIDRYVSAWNEEPGASAASVIMAIQRASHEATWRSKWADDEIESSATGLLYNHVLTLPEAR
jgi:hypothetical protein